jgi:tetratricopeptide (TPR) repeat protein
MKKACIIAIFILFPFIVIAGHQVFQQKPKINADGQKRMPGNIGEKRSEVESLLALSSKQNRMGDKTAALKTARKASGISEQMKDNRLIALCTNAVGRTLTHMGKWSEGLKSFYKALELFREIGDIDGEAEAQLEIGIVHMLSANYDSALKILDEARKKNKRMGNEAKKALADALPLAVNPILKKK